MKKNPHSHHETKHIFVIFMEVSTQENSLLRKETQRETRPLVQVPYTSRARARLQYDKPALRNYTCNRLIRLMSENTVIDYFSSRQSTLLNDY